MDKTIATHTNFDNIYDPYGYKVGMYQMVGCYCYHLHAFSNLRDLIIEDNLNNTFPLNMSFQSIKTSEIAAKLVKGVE